jgi:hypothetical protein
LYCRLGKLPHRHKIFVQGNHDEGQPGSAVASLQNAVSLVDKLTEIEVRGRTVVRLRSHCLPR